MATGGKGLTKKEEFIYVVDKNNKAVGKATRKEVHDKKLMHRSVHILLFNSAGEFFIQKRGYKKDPFPEYWCSGAAGQVPYGETYEQAAKRELKEELGIETSLKLMEILKPSQDTGWEHVVVFVGRYDGEVNINEPPEEILDGKFCKPQALVEKFEEGRIKASPMLKILSKWVLENKEKLAKHGIRI